MDSKTKSNGLTQEERVKRIIDRKDVDYLPSQLEFTDFTRHTEIAKAVGLSSPDELDDYLQNHLKLSFVLDDTPIFFRNEDDYMLEMQEKGIAWPDLKNEIVYDRFGMGTKMHYDSFIDVYHPFGGDKEANKIAAPFLPDNIRKVIDLPLEEAIKKWEIPDASVEVNFEVLKQNIDDNKNGDYYIVPTGYYGTFERANSLLGWQQFMTEIATRPKMIHELLDKITEYKIQLAKEKVKLGFHMQHHGDDFGAQNMGFFSQEMFKEFFKPQLKKLFDVYRTAGCHICLHSCGYIMDYLKDLIDIGVDVIEPIQPSNGLERLKKEYGKDLIFWGGIDVQTLPFISPQETRDMVKHTIHTLGKGGGMIICPSQHLTREVPIENIKAVVETVLEERSKVFD